MNLRSITEVYAKPLGPTLYLLFGAVASLLLIGCANVSILLLARGAQRQHELAVRAALGAGRGRIVRQLFTESLAIAAAGRRSGVLFAWKSLAFIAAWLPSNSFPAESVIEMNLPVLLFSLGLAVVTAIVFGISPALQLSRPDVGRVMQASTRRVMGSAHGKRTHSVMVAAQVALTLLMLTAAGAAGKGFLRLMNTDLGYDPHQTMSRAHPDPRRHLPRGRSDPNTSSRSAPGSPPCRRWCRRAFRPTRRRPRMAGTTGSKSWGRARRRSRSSG